VTTAPAPRSPLARSVVTAVAAIALVASCSTKTDSSAPTKLPPPITATPTPTPTQTPEAQAETFVREYYAAVNEALATGNVNRLETFSTASCVCSYLASAITDVYTKGRMDGAYFSVESVRVTEVQGATSAVEVRYSTSAYSEKDFQGKVLRQYEAGPGHDLLSLVKAGDKWELVDAVRMG
jgi:hypothetical protein